MLIRLIPPALMIALSPITVIPAVLVIHAPRPRSASLAFLGGWLVGLTGLTVFFVATCDLLEHLHKSPPAWVSWLRVLLGVATISFATWWWSTRHRRGDTPGWARPFLTLTPVRAAVTAIVLAPLRFEVLITCATVGLTIGTGGIGAVHGWLNGAVFVAVAGSTVAIPILAYVSAGERLGRELALLKHWMERHHADLEGLILVLAGLMLCYNGLRAF